MNSLNDVKEQDAHGIQWTTKNVTIKKKNPNISFIFVLKIKYEEEKTKTINGRLYAEKWLVHTQVNSTDSHISWHAVGFCLTCFFMNV